jgi:hypothetical protein
MPYEIFLECINNQIIMDKNHITNRRKRNEYLKKKYCKECKKLVRVIKVESRLWYGTS